MIEFLFAIVIVLVLIFKLNKHKIKGKIGELRVSNQLYKLNDEEFKVINDVLIQTDDRSSQIDHIVISIYGIFVIETKNYTGWIHGNENSEYWTQSIYKKKTNFKNPIKQNWAHIYALKEILSDYKHLTYYPIIVFAGNAELKNISSTIPVIYDRELFQTIMSKRRIPNLSIEQVKNIVMKLNKVNIQDKEAKKEHIYQVKNKVHKVKQKEKSLVCPKCGGNLVVRDGQYGKFYGCPNYPNCRYTLNYKTR